MSTKTVAGKTTVATGSHTINSVTVNTASYSGRYSIHDCAYPWQVELDNCIWPIGAPSPVGLTVVNGITVHVPDPVWQFARWRSGGNFRGSARLPSVSPRGQWYL